MQIENSFIKMKKTLTLLMLLVIFSKCSAQEKSISLNREKISINEGWYFYKYDSASKSDELRYDVRPDIKDNTELRVADAKPTEALKVTTEQNILKPWILPTGNQFIADPKKHHLRPEGNPGENFPFVKNEFDDSVWEHVNLPHDWAIKGPFMTGWQAEVSGGMGRLPVNGVAWYRKKLNIPTTDKGKSIFLEVEGAMSYAMVWCNGKLVGGWPYGYNSWRLDLTPYLIPGAENQLAIRLDNPNYSSRWYPGAGIYRNVWLIKTNPVHVSQWGTYITTKKSSDSEAELEIEISVDNATQNGTSIEVSTKIYELDILGRRKGKSLAAFPSSTLMIDKLSSISCKASLKLKNPKLWGPPPEQTPHLYIAVTELRQGGKLVDEYETTFGIRSVEFNADKGLFINGQRIQIKGVNQHHDLGALGAAFNVRAAERQLELLREMGCNAIRMSHNPPAPALLALTDRMGFLVVDEIFDSWERKKTPHDFHLIFQDWSEPDTRAFIRRDRNSPSVILWSLGNEVGEQYTDEAGAAVARRLRDIIREEDSTRPTTSAMNFAKPDMPLPAVLDVISLNYQGEGIRQAAEFEGTDRIRTAPQYDAYHQRFPDKLIMSSETASAFSTRGVYLFPVSPDVSAPVRDGRGGDSKRQQVSSYELHAVDFGSTADKVFGSIESHPFVAGEFVWTGWDHLGEPTPYYESRSSYCGIIDMAGFKKDRFFLYQSHWRPDFRMAHILPHWNWSERIGEITPVHVFTSGDEAELFLNGKSLGRKKKLQYTYRLRWDSVRYTPGQLKVIAYKNGKPWAEESIKTSGEASKLLASADRDLILANGNDLSFITIQVSDKEGLLVPRSDHSINFSIKGPGEIVAIDNGDPTSMVSFSSLQYKVFNGLCVVIVRALAPGEIVLQATADNLTGTSVGIKAK